MAAAYGYTDEQIGELPLARLRQIIAAIKLRQFMEEHETNRRNSWLARTLATFIAGGYMVDKGKSNPGLDLAQQIAYDDIEAALMGVAVTKTAAQSKLPVVDDETNPNGKLEDSYSPLNENRAAELNSNGSFERFLLMNGQLDFKARADSSN